MEAPTSTSVDGLRAGVKIEKPTREPVQLHITSDIGMHSPVTGARRNARVFYALLLDRGPPSECVFLLFVSSYYYFFLRSLLCHIRRE